MKQLKKHLVVLLSMLLFGGLFACSQTPPSSSSEPTISSSESSSEESSNSSSSSSSESSSSEEPTSEPSSEPSSEPTSEPSSSEDSTVYYVVNHYLENLNNDGYDKVFEEVYIGENGANIDIFASIYEGFTPNEEVINVTLSKEEALVVDFYYARNSYTVSFITNGGEPIEDIELKYGYTLPSDIVAIREGYSFDSWYIDIDQSELFENMGAKDVALYAYYSEEIKANEFSYEIKNNKVTINSTTYAGADLVIPSYIGGYPVTKISESAFEGCGFVNVVLPTHLTTISSYLFSDCANLVSIDIPSSVEIIDERAFTGCENLKEINLLGETNLTFIERGAFYNCSSLELFIIPTSVEYVGEYAFYGCDNLIIFSSLSENSSWNSYWHGGSEYYLNAGDKQVFVNDAWYALFSDHAELLVYKGNNDEFDVERNVEGVNVTSIRSDSFRNIPHSFVLYIPSNVTSINGSIFDTCSDVLIFVEADNTTNFAYSWNDGNTYYLNAGLEQEYINDAWYAVFIDHAELIVYLGNSDTFTIENEVNGVGVTHIRDNSFFGNTNLIKITFNENLVSVGLSVFENCTNLLEVIFNEASSLTIIDDRAFYHCISLTKLILPANIEKIDSDAFYDCISLKEVYFNNDISAWCHVLLITQYSSPFNSCPSFYLLNDNGEFETLNELIIPSDVNVINDYQFIYLKSLVKVTIHSGVTSIGVSAFSHCTLLHEVNFLDNSTLTTIHEYAFYYCSSLLSITIPDSVSYIYEAFRGCSSLTSITLPLLNHNVFGYIFGAKSGTQNKTCVPSSLKTINFTSKYATYIPSNFCYELINVENINLCEGITSIGHSAFRYCYSLKQINIPSSVTTIDEDAFNNCGALSSININEDSMLNTIGGSAFYECSKIQEIYLPDSLVKIGDYAFYKCYNLKNITIGENVESIGSRAFYECSRLEYVNFVEETNKLLFGSYAFAYCTKLNEFLMPYGSSSSSYVLAGCSNIHTIRVPNDSDGPSWIMGNATSNLKQVILLDGDDKIKTGAFKGDNYLSIHVPASVTHFEDEAFDCPNAILFHEGEIDYQTFWYVELYDFRDEAGYKQVKIDDAWYGFYDDHASLLTYEGNETELIVPEVVEDKVVNTIAGYAFAFSSIENLILPTSIKYLKSAFANATSLKSVNLEDLELVEEISGYTFNYCTSLKHVILPDGVTKIESYAFYKCNALEFVYIPNTVTIIESNAFNNCSGKIYLAATEVKDGFKSNWNSGRDVNFGAGERAVLQDDIVYGIYNDHACVLKNYSIKDKIILPSKIEGVNLTHIYDRAFYYCRSLTSIVIPSSVTSIDSYAFYDCSSLTSIYIPSSVTSIGENAFYYCSSLTIYYEGNEIPASWDSKWNSGNRPVVFNYGN